jgi:glyoxylase-like metal-dependent hydrolase (beta-lactamase superfamily II)
MSGIDTRPTEIDVELEGGEQFELGDTRIEAVATPGHTAGSMCYWLTRRNGPSALFTGDTIMSFTEFGTYQLRLAPQYGGNAVDFLASIRKLQTLPNPDLLLPGHPAENRIDEDAIPTAESWRALLKRGVDEIQLLLDQAEADGPNFLDDVPKQVVPGAYSLGELQGRSVYCLNSPSGLVLFDAPGPGLVEFLRRRLPMVKHDLTEITAVFLTSSDPEGIKGLHELVDRVRCTVVADSRGLKSIERYCPVGTSLVAASQWTVEPYGIEPLKLAGRGHAPTAYRATCDGKAVLISGKIPTPLFPKLPRGILTHRFDELADALSARDNDCLSYLDSLDRLVAIAPRVWFPAVPLGGQNANLYGDDWLRLITMNKQVAWRQCGENTPEDARR